MPINVTRLSSGKYSARQKIKEFESTWKKHRKYKNTKLHSFMKTNKFIRINLFYAHINLFSTKLDGERLLCQQLGNSVHTKLQDKK